jgi:hypothetical protein
MHTPKAEDMHMRFLVYVTLIKVLGIKPERIHRWREAGVLGRRMKQTFDAKLSPSERQRELYLRFCRHKSTFGPVPASETTAGSWPFDACRMAWSFIGGSSSDLDSEIFSAIDAFPGTKNHCFVFVGALLQAMHPTPADSTGMWISFGFCECLTQAEENQLAIRYLKLLRLVDFDTFCNAYASGSLPELFSANQLAIPSRFIVDVLENPYSIKLVWDLKAFVRADDEFALGVIPFLSVCADYGFSNCENKEEEICLRNVYKQFFSQTDCDPLALHEACLRGELFQYVDGFTKLEPRRVFERLMSPQVSSIHFTPESVLLTQHSLSHLQFTRHLQFAK